MTFLLLEKHNLEIGQQFECSYLCVMTKIDFILSLKSANLLLETLKVLKYKCLRSNICCKMMYAGLTALFRCLSLWPCGCLFVYVSCTSILLILMFFFDLLLALLLFYIFKYWVG